MLACLSALVSRIHRISGPRFTQRVLSIKPTVNQKKDVVGEVEGMDVMGVLVAGRGARDRGGSRIEV